MQEAKTLAEKIINRGKEAFSNKCYQDALWKYANAYELCCVNSLSDNIKGKVLLYCAAASLNLLKESPPHKHYLLGSYSVSCSTRCINAALPELQCEVSIMYWAIFYLNYFDYTWCHHIQAYYKRAQVWKYLQLKDRMQCELDDCISSFESAVNFLPKHLHLATDALKEAIILAINTSEFLLPL